MARNGKIKIPMMIHKCIKNNTFILENYLENKFKVKPQQIQS